MALNSYGEAREDDEGCPKLGVQNVLLGLNSAESLGNRAFARVHPLQTIHNPWVFQTRYKSRSPPGKGLAPEGRGPGKVSPARGGGLAGRPAFARSPFAPTPTARHALPTACVPIPKPPPGSFFFYLPPLVQSRKFPGLPLPACRQLPGVPDCNQAFLFPPARVSKLSKELQGREASGHGLPRSSECKTQRSFRRKGRRAKRKPPPLRRLETWQEESKGVKGGRKAKERKQEVYLQEPKGSTAWGSRLGLRDRAPEDRFMTGPKRGWGHSKAGLLLEGQSAVPEKVSGGKQCPGNLRIPEYRWDTAFGERLIILSAQH
ncbi:hypothetical protein H8959_022056 [Pygathrix nigripes]